MDSKAKEVSAMVATTASSDVSNLQSMNNATTDEEEKERKCTTRTESTTPSMTVVDIPPHHLRNDGDHGDNDEGHDRIDRPKQQHHQRLGLLGGQSQSLEPQQEQQHPLTTGEESPLHLKTSKHNTTMDNIHHHHHHKQHHNKRPSSIDGCESDQTLESIAPSPLVIGGGGGGVGGGGGSESETTTTLTAPPESPQHQIPSPPPASPQITSTSSPALAAIASPPHVLPSPPHRRNLTLTSSGETTTSTEQHVESAATTTTAAAAAPGGGGGAVMNAPSSLPSSPSRGALASSEVRNCYYYISLSAGRKMVEYVFVLGRFICSHIFIQS